MANKINEIIDVLNNESIEGLTNRVDNLEDRIAQLEEVVDKPWILCPSDLDLFDFNNNKVNYDLKIVYSLTYNYQHTDADNPTDKLITGTIFFNKNDPIDATQSAIFKLQGVTTFDIYNIVFVDTGITFSSIDYGIGHSPMGTILKGTSYNPSNGNCRIRTKTANVNYQTDDMSISYNNPFINIYYKGE